MRTKRARYLRKLAEHAHPTLPAVQYGVTRHKKILRVRGGKPVILDVMHVSLGNCQRRVYQNLKKAWHGKYVSAFTIPRRRAVEVDAKPQE